MAGERVGWLLLALAGCNGRECVENEFVYFMPIMVCTGGKVTTCIPVMTPIYECRVEVKGDTTWYHPRNGDDSLTISRPAEAGKGLSDG